jgi:SPP1 family phage portal protein
MVRDNSVDHRKLFFVSYIQQEDITGTAYYIVYVYTKDMVYRYAASVGLDNFELEEAIPHFFGEVPAVEYQNNSDRLGDFELQLSLIHAYDDLISSRVEDKKKFVDSVLALYGASLEDGAIEALEETKFVDGLPGPSEARLEYVQKTFDEESVQILANNLVDEIQKQSFVVDMTDTAFGTASGQALRMKLFGMTVLIKNKIRTMERGLKKRFEMYNHYLMSQGLMGYVSRDSISPIFTISVPVDENGVADIVAKLNGIVDRETLLSLLWFVKDPAKAAEKAKQEAAEADESYLDTFGITANRKENVGTDYTEE